MPGCQHLNECSDMETLEERLDFCLEGLDRGSFRGCAYGFVKNGDTIYAPCRKV